jgi:hypothetical protein
MELIEKTKDSLKKVKNGTIVFEKEDGEKLHFFILDSDGMGFKTEIEAKVLEEYEGKEDELVSSLEYSSLTAEDIEFFNLQKRAYTLLDQGALVALKKYIYRTVG